MLKKVLQVVTGFGLLLAGYALYVRAFAEVVQRLAPASPPALDRAAGHAPKRSEQKATEVAVRGFGPGHWTTDAVLGYRYYNAERRYWMYTRDYKRLNGGKQLEFAPFAIVWESRDGKSLMTATSDSAKIDLAQPLGLVSKPGEGSGSMRVIRARVEGNVLIRDDKGTPSLADDLRISFPGPVPSIEYDEATLEVKSDSSVVIEDRDLRITGDGLLITLRPKETPGPRPEGAEARGAHPSATAGFNGAQSAVLRKNVQIVISDVGPDGILPGNARPEQQRGAKTPLEVRCAGMMQIDLPKPRMPVKIGPPAPPGPTIAQFFRNVEVIRGRPGEAPDQLDCDHLRLTLVNVEKPQPQRGSDPAKAATKAETPDQGEPGPLRELTLQRALASGHNVRITSASQGVKARCNELIHEKGLPDKPDATYFRGDPTSKLIVEKTDIAESGPNRGKVTSFTTIRTLDAILFDSGKGNEAITIVARGAGELETRPAADQPVERSAKWSDQLSLTDDPATASKLGLPGLKKVTLTGEPSIVDHPSKSDLSARDVLVVWLKPKTSAVATVLAPVVVQAPGLEPAPAPVSQAFEINRLVALKDVRLASPGKILVARDRLDAVFESEPAPTITTTVTTRSTAPTVAAPAPPAQAVASTNPPATTPPKAAEPDAEASAGRVWALVRLGPSGAGARPTPGNDESRKAGPGAFAAEIREVRLRGSVVFHQDPPAGKTQGVDVSGEAVDLSNHGDGMMRFAVFHHDPNAAKASAAAPSKNQKGEEPADLAPLARVQTEELTILGKVIGLDQSTDEAWVDGRGSLTQLSAKGLLSDKGLANAPEGGSSAPLTIRPAAPDGTPVKKVPITISWADGMKFFGQSTDPQGRQAARAEFYKDVRAETEDALLTCATVMRTYLDRTLKLSKPEAPSPGNQPVRGGLSGVSGVGGGSPGEPKADIALIECVGNVLVVHETLDKDGKTVAQKQRIEGSYLLFDKATGKFDVPGTGQVVLYQRDAPANLLGPAGTRSENRSDLRAPGDPKILQVADGPGAGVGPPVVGRVPGPLDRAGAQRGNLGAATGRGARVPRPSVAPPPLVVTQVKFRKGMTGRFGAGKLTDRQETRRADFFGDIEVVHGPVPDAEALLDPDNLPRDAQFMTSQILRVVSEPKVGKAGQPDPPPVYLLRAWENAVVTSGDKTITADTITFDSEKQLFWAYGEGGRPVVVAQQEQVGLGFSNLTGRAAVYNHQTGQARVIEPSGLQILDARTGIRPGPVSATPEVAKPQLPKRRPLRNPAGNLNDRKGFRGGL